MDARPLIKMALGLPACLVATGVLAGAAPVKVKPVRTETTAGLADDGLYLDAASAISRRDYPRALDLLQAARARKADDPRVLNAFGVVYDKLGRFDLSGAYYAQARALDPGSPIVAANMAYSAWLQAKSKRDAP
jgi:Flp pilus assembly protein TadD